MFSKTALNNKGGGEGGVKTEKIIMYIILKGPFYSTQNSGHFGWYIKCNEPFRFGPTGIFGTSFEGGPL